MIDTLAPLGFLGLIVLMIYAIFRTIKKVRAARYLTELFQSGELRSISLYRGRTGRELRFELGNGKTYDVRESDGYLGTGSVPVSTKLTLMKFKHIVWGAKSLVHGDNYTFRHEFGGIDREWPVWKLTYGPAWPDSLEVRASHG